MQAALFCVNSIQDDSVIFYFSLLNFDFIFLLLLTREVGQRGYHEGDGCAVVDDLGFSMPLDYVAEKNHGHDDDDNPNQFLLQIVECGNRGRCSIGKKVFHIIFFASSFKKFSLK